MMTPERFVHYKLGNDKHDQQHWQLLLQMNAIVQDIKDGTFHPASLDKLLADLTNHFTTEVNYMVMSKFPYLRAHIDDHERMIRTLSKAIQDATSHQGVIASLLASKMEDLFTNHIEQFDRQYAAYIDPGC